jgi:hypothetical protein
MTLLPQLEQELLQAAARPPLMRRVMVVVAVGLIAAMIALLATAPPSIARLPAPPSAVVAYLGH